MTDHDFDARLRSWATARSNQPLPPGLHGRVLGIPSTTSQQHGFLPLAKVGFGSVFNATKFVAAGVIVALAGGFLLSGVLTDQPERGVLPAAARSTLTSARSSTRLLPDVDLKVVSMAPGVYRVLADGQRSLRDDIVDIEVTPTGDVWVLRYSGHWSGKATNVRVVRLGRPGVEYRVEDGHGDVGLKSRRDGMPALTYRGGAVRYDGEGWVKDKTTAFERCAAGEARDVRQFGFTGGVAADGACWYSSKGTWHRVLEDGSAQGGEDEEPLDLPDGPQSSRLTRCCLTVTADGTVMAAIRNEEPRTFIGVTTFDGREWTTIPYEAGDADSPSFVAKAPDGRIWVTAWDRADDLGPASESGEVEPRGLIALSWDGVSWTRYGPLEVADPGLTDSFFQRRPFPGGYAWFAGVAMFDGTSLRRIDLGGLPATADLWEVAPDGRIWALDSDQGALYVIDPEAVEAQSNAE